MSGRRIAARLIVAVFAWAHFAQAQQTTIHRIGFLSPVTAASMAQRVGAFRQGLHELGYVEEQNLKIEFRWAEGKDERLSSLAAELVRLKPAIMVTHGVLATVAAKKASASIPIVCLAWRFHFHEAG